MNRTISATWACRSQRMSMNKCMIGHATQEEQDAAREEWFATRDKREEERKAKEKRRIEQEKFHREWWGLDENGRRKLENEKLAKENR
jgi:COX assembly protein 1